MSTSSQFATAVHLLVYLAINVEESAVTSERIAASVNTAASVIRRLLMQLSAAGLTTSQLGTGGGAKLAKTPESITLLAIYTAVEGVEAFALHRTPPNPACRVGRNILAVLESVASETELAMRRVLENRTLADVANSALKTETARRRKGN